MSAAERKRRQRDRERAEREQAAFAFAREQEQMRHNVTAQVTKQASYTVTSSVTLSALAAPELTCFFCGKAPDAVEFMVVWGGDAVMCNECGEGAHNSEEGSWDLELARMTLLEDFMARVSAFKLDVEQLAGDVENHRRNGLVPEAEQALSVRAQQHLEAMIAAADAIIEGRE